VLKYLIVYVGAVVFSFAAIAADKFDASVCMAYSAPQSREQCIAELGSAQPAQSAVSSEPKAATPKLKAQPAMPPSYLQQQKRQQRNIDAEIRAFARRKFPSDPRMEDYTYNKQVDAYNYLRTLRGAEIMAIAARKPAGLR
jgi:hypothetical protein